MGDDLDHRDHRLSMGEGGWDGGVYSFIQTTQTMEPLYLMQQSSKEISNKECIGKDQCPNGHSLETNFNPSYPFCFTNAEYLIPIHLFFYQQFMIMVEFVYRLEVLNLIFESLFHNFNNSKTNDNKHKN